MMQSILSMLQLYLVLEDGGSVFFYIWYFSLEKKNHTALYSRNKPRLF